MSESWPSNVLKNVQGMSETGPHHVWHMTQTTSTDDYIMSAPWLCHVWCLTQSYLKHDELTSQTLPETCIDACMHLFTQPWMHAWRNLCMHNCMHTCMQKCMYKCMHGCLIVSFRNPYKKHWSQVWESGVPVGNLGLRSGSVRSLNARLCHSGIATGNIGLRSGSLVLL